MTSVKAASTSSPPWQYEWKRPQWLFTAGSRKGNKQQHQHHHQQQQQQQVDVVMGITTAQITKQEVEQSLFKLDSDIEKKKKKIDSTSTSAAASSSSQYLLSVTLLGNKSSSTSSSSSSSSTTTAQPLASQVLLEVVEIPFIMNNQVHNDQDDENEDDNKSSQADTTSVLYSKRLQWPETATQRKEEVNKSSNYISSSGISQKRRNKRKIENWFTSLFGIDEEQEEQDQDHDEAEQVVVDEQKTIEFISSSLAPQQQQRSAGLVSATLFRRSSNTCNSDSHTYGKDDKATGAMDIIQCMNLGIDHDVNEQTIKESVHARNANNNEEFSSNNGNTVATNSTNNDGDLFLVCLSYSGKVYVYNPFTLLDERNKDNNSDTQTHYQQDQDFDKMSKFFFGQDLFHTLQTQYKPLSEPISKVRLSIFEHDIKQRDTIEQQQSLLHHPINDDNDDGDDDDDDGSVSVLSVSSSIQDQNQFLLGCPPPPQQHPSAPLPSPASSKQSSTASKYRHHHRRLSPPSLYRGLIDPLLWNPLLEQSTIRNRTYANKPLSVNVAGSSYLVVTGKGIPYGQTRRRNTRQHGNKKNEQSILSPETTKNSILKLSRNETLILQDNETVPSTDFLSSTTRKNREWWESSKDILPVETFQNKDENDQKYDTKNNNNNDDDDDDDDDDHKSNPSRNSSHTSKSGLKSRSSATYRRSRHSVRTKRDPEIEKQHASFDNGGFVTFISTAKWSESRTLFLDFEPINISYISNWYEMEFVMIIGYNKAVLIRIDTWGPSTIPIGMVDKDKILSLSPNSTYSGQNDHEDENESKFVKKFQILTVDIKIDDRIPYRLLCGSNTGAQPPSLLSLYLDPMEFNSIKEDISSETKQDAVHLNHEHALVLQHSLSHCTDHGTVALRHKPSQVAKLILSSTHHDNARHNKHILLDNNKKSVWAQHGQGWSLLGVHRSVYFICWEGSTPIDGAFVQEVSPNMMASFPSIDEVDVHSTHVLPLILETQTLPFVSSAQNKVINNTYSSATQLGHNPRQSMSAMIPLPFSTDFEIESLKQSYGTTTNAIDVDVIFQAMKDLSDPYVQTDKTKKYSNDAQADIGDDESPKFMPLSHRQKSERLLQHCSSWTQLQDTLNDRIVLERQEPVIAIRFGFPQTLHCLVTLRQLVVKNGPSSPFQQILAWLAKQGNFFTAASIALDLLQDPETLFHLWKHAKLIDELDEVSKLEGLLDGITSIRLVDEVDLSKGVYIVHLADMTVGCLIKGGALMAQTLMKFLQKNKYYDPARACLMLAATTVNAVSGDSELVGAVMGNSSHNAEIIELLWPVDCLLKIGVARDYLGTALLLLNVTIPDELRHRPRQTPQLNDKPSKTTLPNLELTKKLIVLIVSSDPQSLNILLDFIDEQSQLRYWQSLDRETQLFLSLIEIDHSFPLIRNPEIRAWLREELNSCLKQRVDLPTSWIQELCVACLKNAGCELTDLEIVGDPFGLTSTSSLPETGEDAMSTSNANKQPLVRDESINPDGDDKGGLKKLKLEFEETCNALMPLNSEYSVDYDLLISSLLLLEGRNVPWLPRIIFTEEQKLESSSFEKYTSTQSLLNAACHLAGRRSKPVILTTEIKEDQDDEKPYLFVAFDSTTAMRQCYLANNIAAGAYLIGGKDGFILHICQILIKEVGFSMSDAESFILDDDLHISMLEGMKTFSSFELTDSHRRLLWLLDEHVLSVRTFGEFETIHLRGRVNPVFAARSCFRAWLCISYGDKKTASLWLCQWLKHRLGIGIKSGTNDVDDNDKSAISGHRLPCAALVRSLIWPSIDSGIDSTSHSHPSSTNPLTAIDDDYTGDDTLAVSMEIETTFLIQICECSVGLVESVPTNALEVKI